MHSRIKSRNSVRTCSCGLERTRIHLSRAVQPHKRENHHEELKALDLIELGNAGQDEYLAGEFLSLNRSGGVRKSGEEALGFDGIKTPQWLGAASDSK